MVINLKEEGKNVNLTACGVLGIQCQPNGAEFKISRVYLEKEDGEPEVQRELVKLWVNFPAENRPADDKIEIVGSFEEGTMWMEKIIATGWFTNDDFVHASADETFKFRSKDNNDIVLCELIPANGGGEDKWVQAIFKFSNYWEDGTEKGTPCKLFELDVNKSQYAWKEGMPEPDPEGIENTAVDTKAVKRIVNGQLIIEKNGKFFNALGAELK